jgi:hypothetical protein
MTYYAFHENGLSVNNPNLSDLSQLPDIEYIIKVEYIAGRSAKYTVVNSDGSIRLLAVGGFELRDVDYVGFNSVTKKYPVTLTLCETRLNHVFQVSIDAVSDASIYPKYILPFLKILDEHGSYKSYEQSLEIEKLTSKVSSLSRQLEDCRKIQPSDQ